METNNKNENAVYEWKPSKKLIGGMIAMAIVLCMAITYIFLMYTDNKFISKWRTIYIETAMSTKTHQWLAEWFIPHGVIDEVMRNKREELERQKDNNSDWDGTGDFENEEIAGERDFYNVYYELDTDEFRTFLKRHSELLKDGYENLVIEDFDEQYGLMTAQGDPVIVVNAKEKVIIVGLSGSGYVGKMAIVKDPSKVTLAKSEMLGSYGQEVETYAKKYDALIAINGSMFSDADGHGSGGIVRGCLVIDGVDYGDPKGDDWKFFGMKKGDDHLNIVTYKPSIVEDYRWAIQCYPALVINGQSIVDGTFGMGIHPRAAIGQNERGDFFLLVIDGRQVGYSLGCTVSDCAFHMAKYDAYQAVNIDGGSSAVMFYLGKQITKSSSATGRGRYIPDSIMVLRQNSGN